ncbi:hypothetical protein Tco_0264477 [Tanacetum coccineum]
MPQISLSIALAPMSSILEPEESLIMGNEELSTNLEKESDEFINSSVEDLIPIPRESEDTSGSDSESILPSSDDFSSIFEEKSDIECKDSYDSNLDESTFLVTPLSDSNKDEFFTPRDDVELLLHHDPSISIVSILEGFTDEPPFEENDDLLDLESKENDWKKIFYDAPIDDLITEQCLSMGDFGNGYPTKGRKIKQKRTKPSTEWKSMEKTKSNRSQSQPRQSQSQEVIKSKKIQL